MENNSSRAVKIPRVNFRFNYVFFKSNVLGSLNIDNELWVDIFSNFESLIIRLAVNINRDIPVS